MTVEVDVFFFFFKAANDYITERMETVNNISAKVRVLVFLSANYICRQVSQPSFWMPACSNLCPFNWWLCGLVLLVCAVLSTLPRRNLIWHKPNY